MDLHKIIGIVLFILTGREDLRHCWNRLNATALYQFLCANNNLIFGLLGGHSQLLEFNTMTYWRSSSFK